MSIFKVNDIRGKYPEEWDNDTAYKIGVALGSIFTGRKVVIGRDGRTTSKEILHYLTQGLTNCEMEISDLGIVDTPAVYFAVGAYGFDGGIMITASHNPVGYNGIKLVGRNAAPFDYETGIKPIEVLVREIEPGTHYWENKTKVSNPVLSLDIEKDYLEFLKQFRTDNSGLKVVFDCSNGAAGRFVKNILKDFTGKAFLLNEDIDGTFPAHGPNPGKKGSLDQLKEKVLETGSDLGFCFDGDADRVVMIDNKGSVVSPDLITALLGEYFFRVNKNSPDKTKVLVDIRSSNSVGEYLKYLGIDVLQCPVGHAKIKKMMREENATFAGELTGHYYFKDNFYCDSAWLTVFIMLNILSETEDNLSVLSGRIMKYAFSGELSFSLKDQEKQDLAILGLSEKYSYAEMDYLDGSRFNFPEWWFIVRKSGTEPLLRLVVEAKESGELEKRVKDLKEIIYRLGGSDHLS